MSALQTQTEMIKDETTNTFLTLKKVVLEKSRVHCIRHRTYGFRPSLQSNMIMICATRDQVTTRRSKASEVCDLKTLHFDRI